MIPHDQWLWMGHPAHLCVRSRCQFRLATKVGAYIVSTVGEYQPASDRAANERIGCDRMYETFVFQSAPEAIACGCYEITGDELDTYAANDAKTATANHYAACEKYSALQ